MLTLFQHFPVLFPWRDRPAWFNALYDYVSFWGGVDLFFAVSGFVVTSSLLRELSAARGAHHSWSATKRFWTRRAFRLFPLAWFWLAIVLVCSAFWNDSSQFGRVDDNARQALWIFFYLYNWVAYGLFVAGVNIAPLGVYWSLSLEEQFYVLVPLLLIAVHRRALMAILAAAIAIQFFLWRPGPWLDPMWGLRSDALAWGVLIAFLARGPWHERLRPTWLATRTTAFAANALLLGAITLISMPLLMVAIATGVVVLASAAWVWLASYERGYVLPTRSARPILLWFGARSYSLYLAHVTVFMLVNEITFRLAAARGLATDASWLWIHAVLGAVLLFAAAELGYRFIEGPLRNYGRALAERMA